MGRRARPVRRPTTFTSGMTWNRRRVCSSGVRRNRRTALNGTSGATLRRIRCSTIGSAKIPIRSAYAPPWPRCTAGRLSPAVPRSSRDAEGIEHAGDFRLVGPDEGHVVGRRTARHAGQPVIDPQIAIHRAEDQGEDRRSDQDEDDE